VKRAALEDRAPSLSDIVGWQDVSEDPLPGLYQRAFCYYLVNSLIQNGPHRADFLQWLNTYAGPNPNSAQYLFPTESAWQKQLLEAAARSHDRVYTWDDSAAALASAEPIIIETKKPADTRVCTLDTVLSAQRDDDLLLALQKKIFDLTALELRAHPDWRPIFALYRYGLSAVVTGHLDQAQKYLQQAEHQRAEEAAYHAKLVDYINWFEVTKDLTGQSSEFKSYFSTAREMEQIQADPAHPNPLRTDLNKAESALQ